MIKKSLLLFLIIQFPILISAQENELGNWIMYFGQNRLSDQFSIHSEVQYRNHKVSPVYENIEQLLIRFGGNYHFADNAIASAGYAYIASHEYESEQNYPESEEHRIWQQFLLYNLVGRVKFEHRYRVEQRWVNDDYKNRLRYRLMLFIPINNKKIVPKTWLIGLYDEIFLNTEEVFFDRNRLYGALGYQFNSSTQVQVGLLHQQVNTFGKRYLQFAVIYNPDFRQ